MPNYIQGLSGLWEELEEERGIYLLSGLRNIPKEDTGKYIRHEIHKYIGVNGVFRKSGFILYGPSGNIKVLIF